MAKYITETDANYGTPCGTYDLRYHSYERRAFVLDPGCDSGVPERKLEHLQLNWNEVAVAICTSHPHQPVTTIYGSKRVREAWHKSQAEEQGEGE